MFITYLSFRNVESGGRRDLDKTFWKVEHHIIPRFAGGSNEQTNRISLHQYEHALVHLFRYLSFSPRANSKDFNAWSSACLTEQQISDRQNIQNQKRLQGYEKTTRNTEWQKIQGLKGIQNSAQSRTGRSTSSELQRRINSETGKQTQFLNSRKRVSPWTWFLCQQKLTFQNGEENICTVNVSCPKQKQTVRHIVSYLKNQFPNCSIPEEEKRYSNFGALFRLEKQKMWNWSFVSIGIEVSTDNFVEFPFETDSEKHSLYELFCTFFYYLYSETKIDENSIFVFYDFCWNEFSPKFSMFEKSEVFLLFSTIRNFIAEYETIVPIRSRGNRQYVEQFSEIANKNFNC